MARSPPRDTDNLFQDLDDEAIFEKLTDKSTVLHDCTNFVVEFGHDRAQYALDLNVEHYKSLFRNRDPSLPIRWINIWDTTKQHEVMDFLGEEYNFSPRMISVMKRAKTSKHRSDKNLFSPSQADNNNTHHHVGGAATESVQIVDPEKGNASTSTASNGQSGTSSSSSSSMPGTRSNDTGMPGGDDVRLFELLQDKVNYSSIDQTSNALCIGAHWLHNRVDPAKTNSKEDTDRPVSLMPPKHWLWLVLTNDNTVLSLHEDPAIEQPHEMTISQWQKHRYECLRHIRGNTISVFLQLSTHGGEEYVHKPLSQNSIRKAMRDKHKRILPLYQKHAQETGWDSDVLASKMQPKLDSLKLEGASNLFYYLFEDYAAAATFEAAERTLKELTPIVLESDTRKMKPHTARIIPRLHSLGADLRELKHLFENYKAMIQKILQTTSLEKSQGGLRRSLSILDPMDEDFGDDGVIFMAKSARERFERLGERLQWLMLNTIQGYQDETAALSDTYFNLMQQRDTAATARLNRSATLLAKLSVFFLPLNFVTSYYSIQIQEMYEAWVTWDFERAMAITVCVSFVALFFFNKMLFVLIDALDKVAIKVEGTLGGAFMATGAKVQKSLVHRRTAKGGADAARETSGQSD